jgi:DNA-binding response OmpR family regulator
MRLLLIEDEASLVALLRDGLATAGFVVDHARGLADAGAYLQVAQYDALVLDLGLVDGCGLSLLRRLRDRGDGVPILILTARDAPEDRVTGLDSGADDYVVKPFHMNELVSRIRALLRRPNAVLGVRLALGALELDTVSRTTRVAGTPLPLSIRETTLLELLLRRAGRVVAREALDQGLYGMDRPTTPNAIEVLVYRLRKRLQDAGADVVIHTLRGVGYLLATPE